MFSSPAAGGDLIGYGVEGKTLLGRIEHASADSYRPKALAGDFNVELHDISRLASASCFRTIV